MPLSGTASNFKEIESTGIDANNIASTTDSIDFSDAKYVSFSVKGVTGTHNNHVFVLQCSPNDVDWYDISEAAVTGEGMLHDELCAAKYARIKCETAEGSTSTVDICIQIK